MIAVPRRRTVPPLPPPSGPVGPLADAVPTISLRAAMTSMPDA